jgi:hypothetical protein
MTDLGDQAKLARISWCEPDGCPADICGGPHRWAAAGGMEFLIHVGQDPAEAIAAILNDEPEGD